MKGIHMHKKMINEKELWNICRHTERKTNFIPRAELGLFIFAWIL
jgi:hypothetical protein